MWRAHTIHDSRLCNTDFWQVANVEIISFLLHFGEFLNGLLHSPLLHNHHHPVLRLPPQRLGSFVQSDRENKMRKHSLGFWFGLTYDKCIIQLLHVPSRAAFNLSLPHPSCAVAWMPARRIETVLFVPLGRRLGHLNNINTGTIHSNQYVNVNRMGQELWRRICCTITKEFRTTKKCLNKFIVPTGQIVVQSECQLISK